MLLRAEPFVMDEVTDRAAESIYGISRSDAHARYICVKCKCHITTNRFRDQLSSEEYDISAFCQACQDEVFQSCFADVDVDVDVKAPANAN